MENAKLRHRRGKSLHQAIGHTANPWKRFGWIERNPFAAQNLQRTDVDVSSEDGTSGVHEIFASKNGPAETMNIHRSRRSVKPLPVFLVLFGFVWRNRVVDMKERFALSKKIQHTQPAD